MIISESYDELKRTAIADAALYFDEVKPGWHLEIDPVKLNMFSSKKCVCGQIGLDWGLVQHHLTRTNSNDNTGIFSSPWLEPLWLEEIAKRMPVPVEEPERVLA